MLFFPGPRSATGDDVLELHVHGGPATVRAVLAAVPRSCLSANVRHAEPGEFTRRAFLNGRLDLAQVEALADTLAAETERQRRAAVRGRAGTLSRTYDGWRGQLLQARGELEALIDFSEDHDFADAAGDAALLAAVDARVAALMTAIETHEAAARRGELLRRGLRVALLGPPNAGKSSLLNRLAGRDAAIVSAAAGTTRDVVEVRLDVDGFLCTVADTAGLRAADRAGDIELEGIRRAKAHGRAADVVVALTSVERAAAAASWHIRYDADALRIAARAPKFLVAVNKADLLPPATLAPLLADFTAAAVPPGAVAVLPISCVATVDDDGNMRRLVDGLAAAARHLTTADLDDHALLAVSERQRQLLAACRGHCDAYRAAAPADVVVAAEHLRAAADSLARITGRGGGGDVEEVLGVVFEK